MRAEERTSEALLEAWSATLAASERLEVAAKECDRDSLVRQFCDIILFQGALGRPRTWPDICWCVVQVWFILVDARKPIKLLVGLLDLE